MKLYCGISFHGFGHIAQVAPLVNALSQQQKLSELTLHCAAPNELLENWFEPNFNHIPHATDLGIAMFNAVYVDADATYKQYSEQYPLRTSLVNQFAAHIDRSDADLVLTNNSPLLSRAAQQCGRPCVHLGSLNWADHFFEYCKDRPQAEEIYQTMCADYNCADTFFRLPPHMPMPHLKNLVDVGPICRVGKKIDLKHYFQHREDYHYILISMGGMPYPIDFQNWTVPKQYFFIYAGSEAGPKNQGMHIKNTQLAHQDLVSSCDAVITKPGNGTYAEAACSGTPILYLPREDWPEESHLNNWQKQRGFCQPISEQQLQSGSFEAALEQAIQSQASLIETPSGIGDVIAHIAP